MTYFSSTLIIAGILIGLNARMMLWQPDEPKPETLPVKKLLIMEIVAVAMIITGLFLNKNIPPLTQFVSSVIGLVIILRHLQHISKYKKKD